MDTCLMRAKYRLHISWYSSDSFTDEDEVIEVHRLCYAMTPLMKRSYAGYVNMLAFHDEGGEIEIVCEDVEYLLETVAPVMRCFLFMSDGFNSSCSQPNVWYTALGCPEEKVEEIKVDLSKYVPKDCDTESDES